MVRQYCCKVFLVGVCLCSCLNLAYAHAITQSPERLIEQTSSIALTTSSTPSSTSGNGPNSAWNLPTPSRTFSGGLLHTYLIGAALGIIDYAGLHRLDHPVHENTSGVWSLAKSPQFPAELIGLTLAGAVWEGGRSRLGKTLWQSVDAAAMAGISTQGLKWTFQRTRPSATMNPDRWFQGMHNQSFPSGDVSSITALVTPIILEYHQTNPGVDALAGIPVFDMVARMKAHGHWLTDTLAGAAVGVASGYFAHQLTSPFILGLLPNGFYMGLRERFQ